MSIAIDAPAPPFRLPATGGATADLAAIDAPVVVVAFWCNHCPYVQAWEDRLKDIARDYAGRGVAVVAINANDPVTYPADDFPAMERRAVERGYTFTYAHDTTQDVARAYGAARTPEVFVLDADRHVRYHGAIDDSRDPAGIRVAYLRDALDALLAGGNPGTAETPPVGCTIKWAR